MNSMVLLFVQSIVYLLHIKCDDLSYILKSRNLPDDYFPNNSKFSVKGEVTHIMIRAARGFYDLGGGQQFSTLQSLGMNDCILHGILCNSLT